MKKTNLKSLFISMVVGLSLIFNSSIGFANTQTVKSNAITNPLHSNYLAYTKTKKTVKKEVTVYITKTGSKYHRAGCRYLKRSCISIKLSEAKQYYEPCSVCNPPQ